MKTIVITAYASSPYKGSEDATGWNIAREIAKTNRVVVITRKNNMPDIEKYKAEHEDSIVENMQFFGFDLPQWILWLKKRSGARGYVLYFYLWQLFIPLFIRRKKIQFDIAHSLNFHSDSHPHFLWLLGKPTFWGPIGHHPKVPKSYLLPVYGWKHYLIDRSHVVVKWMMRNLDPFYRIAVWKSEKIFVINSSVKKAVGSKGDKFIHLPAVASLPNYLKTEEQKKFDILSVGRFHYMKGFDIVIRAFAQFYHSISDLERAEIQLTLVGKGAEKERLLKIAKEEKITNAIRWIDWVPQREMRAIYASSSVFLFPSHEGAGMVVPEAMSHGLPVVCFDNYGPGELCGDHALKVGYSSYSISVQQFADRLRLLYLDDTFLSKMKRISRQHFEAKYTWGYKQQIINTAYNQCA